VTLVARHAALSDIGLHRAANEDSFTAGDSLYVVADGMGGAQAGEVASQLAVETVVEQVGAGADLLEAAAQANQRIHQLAIDSPDRKGMGTTLTALSIAGDRGVAIHIGDSRLYRQRDSLLEQLSDDHSMVGQWLREGTITPEEAAVSRYRSVLTRALGTEAEAQVDRFEVDLRLGDRLLLCSDGLCSLVPAEVIGKILAQGSPEVVARELVREAKNRGGYDNVTVVVLRLDAAGDVAPDDEVAADEPPADEPPADEPPAEAGTTSPSTAPAVPAGIVVAPAAAARSRRRRHSMIVALIITALIAAALLLLLAFDRLPVGDFLLGLLITGARL